ncbi:hypothetical protein M0R45_000501 [Rubus argutus]|uniref:Uncharacterized protein n=1 Tax=Rubus argutus TaxID=59490 RepID=A0AAW1VML6_RUBAR
MFKRDEIRGLEDTFVGERSSDVAIHDNTKHLSGRRMFKRSLLDNIQGLEDTLVGEGSSDVEIHDNTKHLSDRPLFKRDEIRDLEDIHVDPGDWNTFYRAVFMDKIEMAKDMVEKNKKILTIGFPSEGRLPVLWAYTNDQFKMARYLYQHTPLNALKSRSGAELISQSFSKKEVDIAWDLIHRCPSLAVATYYFGHSPLNALAGIHIEPTLTHSGNIPPPATNDIRINVQREENNEDNHRNINRTGILFYVPFVYY